MTKLQPYHIFNAEAERLNRLYWTSKYTYRRLADILHAIAQSGTSNDNPKVNEIWDSIVNGEKRHISKGLSEFTAQLIQNEEDLRYTSILHMCSAFEAALVNYYALCTLYLPQRVDSSVSFAKVPEILRSPEEFDKLRDWAIYTAGKSLKGKYSERISCISNAFKLPKPKPTSRILATIDGYYETRHYIAHDQGLSKADAPDLSVDEVLKTRPTLDEDAWKKMIKDFSLAVEELDTKVQMRVVTDQGVALAVYHVIRRDGEAKVADLRHKIQGERNLDSLDAQTIKDVSINIGFKVVHVSGRTFKIVK